MTLKEKFKLGRKFLKEGSISQADRMFDMCIVHLSSLICALCIYRKRL